VKPTTFRTEKYPVSRFSRLSRKISDFAPKIEKIDLLGTFPCKKYLAFPRKIEKSIFCFRKIDFIDFA